MKFLPQTLLLAAVAVLVIACKSPSPTAEEMVSRISATIDTDTVLMTNLETFATQYPARVSGSEANAGAVRYVYNELLSFGADSVWLQPVKVPHWIPGRSEVYLNVKGNGGRQYLASVPLGTSEGTPSKGVTASVVEVRTPEELEKANVKNKIVFFNMVMDDSVNTYGVASWQRVQGPNLASKKGANAAIVRSLTTVSDNDPHTGVTHFEKGVKRIPAVAISTLAADNISKVLKKNPGWTVTVKSTSSMLPDTVGHNVIAQIRGSIHPERVILLSAHLDSWFNSQCVQDNAVSCCYAMEVIRVFKKLGIEPKNTIRIITYQDEEMYLSGMREYAKIAGVNKEHHIFDLEMDSGGGAPNIFLLNHPKDETDSISAFVLPFLSSLGVKEIHSYSDFEGWPLTASTGAFFSLFYPEGEHYFDLHHSSKDNMDMVDAASVKKSAAAIASYIYLMDLYYGNSDDE